MTCQFIAAIILIEIICPTDFVEVSKVQQEIIFDKLIKLFCILWLQNACIANFGTLIDPRKTLPLLSIRKQYYFSILIIVKQLSGYQMLFSKALTL